MLTSWGNNGKLIENGRTYMNYDAKIKNCKYIVKQIRDLGVADDYLGFYYLVSIEDLLLNNKVEMGSFYKDVYPVVAKIYNKKECTIERDIRHLIKQIWMDDNNSKLYNLCFGVKPSCCKFIYVIKNYLIGKIA